MIRKAEPPVDAIEPAEEAKPEVLTDDAVKVLTALVKARERECASLTRDLAGCMAVVNDAQSAYNLCDARLRESKRQHEVLKVALAAVIVPRAGS